MSIRFKVTLILSLVALAACVFMMEHFMLAEPQLQADATVHLEQQTAALNSTLAHELTERYKDTIALSQDRTTQAAESWTQHDEHNPLVAALNSAMARRSGYRLMMLVDAEGTPLAVSNRDGSRKPLNTSALYAENFAGSRWFKEALAGKFLAGPEGLGGVTVVGPYNEKNVGQLYADDGLSLAFAAPVKSDAGKPVGVLVSFVDFGLVERLVRTTYDTLAASGLTKVELLLLDSTGTVIVDANPGQPHGGFARDYTIVGKRNLSKEPVFTQLLKGKPSGVLLPDGHGTLVDAYSYGADADTVNFNWIALARTPESQVFALTDSTRHALLMGTLLLVGFVFLFGMFFGPFIARMIAPGVVSGTAPIAPKTDLAPAMKEIEASASDLLRTAAKVSALAENVPVRAAGPASQECTEAAQELTNSSTSISAQAKTSATAAGNAAARVQTLNESVQSVAENADRIGGMVQFIANIASEINLLALNAAIESARAGEAGQGFAQVASEIKAIATQTANATQEIAQQLQLMQDATSQSKESAGAMVGLIEGINDTASSVASALEKQSAAAQALTKTLGSEPVAPVEGNAKDIQATTQLRASVAMLQEQAGQLTKRIDAFRALARKA